MHYTSAREQAASQGSLRNDVARVDYYITAPSPSQCIAVGVVNWHGTDGQSRRPRRMLVGKGCDEAGAVADLTARFAKLSQPEQPATEGEAPQAANVQDPGQVGSDPAIEGVVAEAGAESQTDSSRA